MNPAWGHAVGAVITILMLTFIGIWIWAWLPHHKRTFDRLARIPMRDPERRAPDSGVTTVDGMDRDE